MADIFISYASEDRPRVEPIAKVLENQGWSVWWDRTIPPGRTFDEVIEDALDSARCVIVIWSKSSVASSWVKTEASEGARRGILIPALIEDVQIPLEFRRVQAANLSDWSGESTHIGMEQLFQSISTHVPDFRATETGSVQDTSQSSEHPLESASSQTSPDSATNAERKKSKKIGWAIGVMAAVVVVIGIAVLLRQLVGIETPDVAKWEPPEDITFTPKDLEIAIQNKEELNPDQEITLEAWFKTNDLSKTQWIVFKPPGQIGEEPYYQYALGFREKKGGIYFPLAINGQREFIDQAFKSVLKIFEWHHVAATYNGSQLSLYIDGEKEDDNPKRSGPINQYNTELRIGGMRKEHERIQVFQGKLAEVRIWKAARSQIQIKNNMNKIIPVSEGAKYGLVWSSTDYLKNAF